MNKLLKLLTITVIALLTAQSCDKDNDAFPIPENKKVSALIDNKSWSAEGSYIIAFGNDPQLFILNCKNDSSQLTLEVRANGKGTYSTIENGYYVSFPQKTIYDIKSGEVTIEEVANNNIATGTFSVEAIDESSGKKVVIKEGKFTKIKGLGYW